MGKDLFGNKIIKKKRMTKLEKFLSKYDKDSFDDRLARLKYLNQIMPKEFGIAADPETVFVFSEAKMSYINGEFIATILLAQAFIERKLQMHYESFGLEKIAKRGLKAIVSHARKNNILHIYLLEKIDILRKKRNPFTHFKSFENEFNLSQRMFKELKKTTEFCKPYQMLENDAKEAISLMYTIFLTKFGKVNQ